MAKGYTKGKGGGGGGGAFASFSRATESALVSRQLDEASRLFPRLYEDEGDDVEGAASYLGMTTSQYDQFARRVAQDRINASGEYQQLSNDALRRIEAAGGVNNLPASQREAATAFLRGAPRGDQIKNPKQWAREKAKEWGIIK